MELKPYLDNDFYIKESRDMITIVQSMIIAGSYQLFYLHEEARWCYKISHIESLINNRSRAIFVNIACTRFTKLEPHLDGYGI